MSPREPVRVEDVEGELPVPVPGLVRQHEVHVVVEVPPRLRGAAGQPQIDPVVDLLVAAVQGAVDVEHRGVALVDVLLREAEHVVVEPVGAHGLVPVPRAFVDTSAVGGAAAAGIRGVRVDAVVAGMADGPVVIVELAGEEVGSGEAVVLRPVVAVVLVGRDRVPSEAAILFRVGRESVVMAEENRLAVAAHDQLGGSVPLKVHRASGPWTGIFG